MEKQLIKKFIAGILTICIITAFLFSVIYINLHASHSCTEHVCSICENLNFVHRILKYVGMSVRSFYAASLSHILILLCNILFLYSINKHTTLVNLKVRLDN